MLLKTNEFSFQLNHINLLENLSIEWPYRFFPPISSLKYIFLS